MNKYHYVYRITNKELNKHYYGVRSSKVEPKLDLGIKYFSSSTDKELINEQKINNSIFKYKVIKIFKTREEAINLEIKLHNKFDVGRNEKFFNKAKQTSTKFDITGKFTGVPKSEVTKLRISKSTKGKKKSHEHILARIKTVTRIQENGKSIMQEAAIKSQQTKISYTSDNPNNIVNIGKKISLTLNEIDESGISKAKARSVKQQLTVKLKIKEDENYYNKITEKRRKTGNTLLENGKTIFQQASITAAKTMKTTIQENGKTIEENRHIKANNTKYLLAGKFNVYHITDGLRYSNLTAMEVYAISASLINKSKDDWLGKNSNSLRSRLINKGENYKLDLYVEKVM